MTSLPVARSTSSWSGLQLMTEIPLATLPTHSSCIRRQRWVFEIQLKYSWNTAKAMPTTFCKETHNAKTLICKMLKCNIYALAPDFFKLLHKTRDSFEDAWEFLLTGLLHLPGMCWDCRVWRLRRLWPHTQTPDPASPEYQQCSHFHPLEESLQLLTKFHFSPFTKTNT